jgi:3-hydroxyisobutyrate dehydrogenase-like beta-hydroxyacid dehydrogenase
MSTFKKIALIGFGEVGTTLAEDLLKVGAEVSAFDILFNDANSRPSKEAAHIPVHKALSAHDAVKDAELIISAVTAAADVEAAQSVIGGMPQGVFFLDLNSASPGMKITSQGIIESAGGRYVEAAVMTPIDAKRIASYMLLGGLHAEEFAERSAPLGFTGKFFSEKVGQASATKMCRSVIIKGVEALLSESMLAARNYGVEKIVLDSLSDLLPLEDWDKVARYMISRALQHGTRRAEEMREAAKTVEESGIEPLMSLATAARQDWSAERQDALAKAGDLGAMLDAIRETIDRNGRGEAA